MSVIDQVIEYWRTLHEAHDCGGGVRTRSGPCGPGAVCPFCAAKAAGVSVTEVMES